MKRVIALLASLAALSLAACSFAPKYHEPKLPLPAAYTVAASTDTIPAEWWTLFGDSVLDSLVYESLTANQDLAAAAARVEEARAFAGIAKADLYPELTATGVGSRSKTAKEFTFTPENPSNRFDLTAGLSYELDFWGRYRNASKAARADLVATEEGQRNVELSLVSDVATTYFDMLTFDKQLAISRETVTSRQESVRLQQIRFDGGIISELDLAQAQGELATAEAAVAILERGQRFTEDRMAVLLGRIGGTVARGDSLAALAVPDVPVGLPSELLARRPDVRAAEQGLVASNARIGVARAAYFPSISLTGYAGYESSDLSKLVTSDAGIWGATASIFEAIFAPGKVQRQVDVAWARDREALAAYTKSVQSAFADVEDALVARRTTTVEREAQVRQVDARQRALKLAQVRYEAGDSSYLEVLDAQRNLFQAQLALTLARRGELASTVTLIQALGGGW